MQYLCTEARREGSRLTSLISRHSPRSKREKIKVIYVLLIGSWAAQVRLSSFSFIWVIAWSHHGNDCWCGNIGTKMDRIGTKVFRLKLQTFLKILVRIGGKQNPLELVWFLK